MRADIEKHIQDYNICISLKAQKHKFYGSLQSLPILIYHWKNLSIDFVTRLPKNKD